jgi:GNAT superfamily N-acetyltransferase
MPTTVHPKCFITADRAVPALLFGTARAAEAKKNRSCRSSGAKCRRGRKAKDLMASRPEQENDGPVPSKPVALREAQLPQALELSRALRWPYRLQDWEFALKLGRGFAVEIGPRLVGTALWWPYGDDYASAGMIIVAEEAQRKGIGAALMDALLADAAGRTVILNSTEEGFALYSRLGFVPHGQVHQHQAALVKPIDPDPARPVRQLRLDDRVAIHALDLLASGMDRRPLIDALFEIGEVKVIESEGRVTGYGCVRPWGRGVVIGPVVAADAADARALIAGLAAGQVGGFVRIDVPVSGGLSPWLEGSGLPRVDRVVAMALGEPPRQASGASLFALSNQSLG